jgi:Nif-specific regulatory protein
MARGHSAIATKEPQGDAPLVPLSEIALTGIYEISKILTVPDRLEKTLSCVLDVLSSFLQMGHAVISLLRDDDIPGLVVGAGWSERAGGQGLILPERALGQVVATAMPLVVENVASHPLFDTADARALGAVDGKLVSVIIVPIRVQSRVVGTITVDRVWDGHSFFGFDADVRFLTMVANLIGQTVQLHRVVARDRERLIAESHRLQKEISELKPAHGTKKANIGGIMGESAAVRDLIQKIVVVAKTHTPVLLRGESGTGKELIAKAIHDSSPRANGPFVKVNCAALPETVLESELFGHEKGAFTGAVSTHKGRFELADKGTLFLDEIGEISPSFQAKLLRVLQEQEFERVGGTKTMKVDVRLVAATNKNLEEAVARHEFRADLYYRINVVTLQPPPLRERRSDIPILACEFLSRFNSENDRNLSFGAGAMDVLTSCYFPGNVRELENCVRRTATLAPGAAIVRNDFACLHNQCLSAMLWNGNCPPAVRSMPQQIPHSVYSPGPLTGNGAHRGSPGGFPPAPAAADPAVGHPSSLERGEPGSERERLLEAMEKAGWVQAKAARLLGLTPRQVGYALKKHDIELRRF